MLRSSLVIVIALTAIAGSTPVLADQRFNAGPFEITNSFCLTARLNPRLGKRCDPPGNPDDQASTGERVDSYRKRAHFFIETREFERAAQDVKNGLALAPDDFELNLVAARLSISSGGDGNSRLVGLEHAERALTQRPGDPDALATSIFIRGVTAAPEVTLSEWGDLIRHHVGHDYSRLERAKLLQGLGQHQDAINDLDVLIARHGRTAPYVALHAVSAMALNRPLDAIKDFDDALSSSPNDTLLRIGRATAYELAGEDAKALDDYDVMIGSPSHPPDVIIPPAMYAKLRLQRAKVLQRLKRLEDAANDVIATLTARASILRMQVFLRNNGFPDIALDGNNSSELRDALRACFGLQACSKVVTRQI